MSTAASASHRFTRWLGRTPRWLRIGLAVVTVVLGAVILVRPTTSLGVLAFLIGAGLVVHGLVELVAHVAPDGAPEASGWRWLRVLVAALWLSAGVFVLTFPGLTVRVLAVIVGVGLVVNGCLSVAAAFRGRESLDARIASVAFGAAGIVFGVLALVWPDITLIVVSVLFGARLVIAGLVLGWRALSPRRGPADAGAGAARPSVLRRWTRTSMALASVAVAVIAAIVSGTLTGGSPVVDDFYAAPRAVPGEPGRLIRAEPFTREVPGDARAWRILYTTERGDGSPAVASGMVVVPRGDGPWPVIDWAHGTTGYAQQCAPSLATQPFSSGALFVLPQLIEHGWALVATDYIGLGTEGSHPYLIGADTAHAALDAVRAAHELDDVRLDDRTAVWGHSQGGAGALWTGALADAYAPELDIEGIAALAPAANLPALASSLDGIAGGSVFASFMVAAYTADYADVTWRQYIRPGAEVTVRRLASRCLAEPGVLVSVLTSLSLSNDPQIFATDPGTGPLAGRLRQNVPPPTLSAPLLLGQGGSDPLIAPAAQDAYVGALCAAGEQVDYRTYAGRDHVGLVEPDSPLIPELFAWTAERFSGQPAAEGCTRTSE